MTRIIKFRAWNKKERIIELVCGIVWDDFATDKIQDLNIGASYHDSIDGFELMQYTGLKDKNGKEIWEGDIVDAPDHCGKEVVIYGPPNFAGAWCVGAWLLGTIDDTDIEIIGNIYENPELLK